MELLNIVECIWNNFQNMDFYKQCMVFSSYTGLIMASFGIFISFPRYIKNQKRIRDEKIAEEFNRLGSIIMNASRKLNELTSSNQNKLSHNEANNLWKLYTADLSKLKNKKLIKAKQKKEVVLGLLDVLGDLEDFSIRINDGSINFEMIVRSSGSLLVKYYDNLEEFVKLIQKENNSNTYYAEYEQLVEKIRIYEVIKTKSIFRRKKLIVKKKKRPSFAVEPLK